MRTPTALLLVAQLGCASITAPRAERMLVNATPDTATITVNGRPVGRPPTAIELSRGDRNQVEVSAPGYQPAVCDASMSPGGGYIAADVVLCAIFFPLGCISFIDAAGAWQQLRSPTCNVQLTREPALQSRLPVAAGRGRLAG